MAAWTNIGSGKRFGGESMNTSVAIVAAAAILAGGYVLGNLYKIEAVAQPDASITVARVNSITGDVKVCTVKGWGVCLLP
jgi:hypothetical protein